MQLPAVPLPDADPVQDALPTSFPERLPQRARG